MIEKGDFLEQKHFLILFERKLITHPIQNRKCNIFNTHIKGNKLQYLNLS